MRTAFEVFWGRGKLIFASFAPPSSQRLATLVLVLSVIACAISKVSYGEPTSGLACIIPPLGQSPGVGRASIPEIRYTPTTVL